MFYVCQGAQYSALNDMHHFISSQAIQCGYCVKPCWMVTCSPKRAVWLVHVPCMGETFR